MQKYCIFYCPEGSLSNSSYNVNTFKIHTNYFFDCYFLEILIKKTTKIELNQCFKT